MTRAIDYRSYVEPVRDELMKTIRAGKVTYYKDLGQKFGKPPRWSLWKTILDDVALAKPDISIIVLLAGKGWQGQIDGKPTKGRPTPEQKRLAQDELTKVFREHCPGRPIPQLPIKRP
jgi:hypothetical protein